MSLDDPTPAPAPRREPSAPEAPPPAELSVAEKVAVLGLLHRGGIPVRRVTHTTPGTAPGPARD